jgi:hypothetical protein
MSQEVDLARQIYEAENDYKVAMKALDMIKTRRKELYEDLQELLDAEGKISTGHIEGVGEIAYREKVYSHVNKDNLPDFIDFLGKNGLDSVVKPTIEAATLKSLCSEIIDQIVEKIDHLKEQSFDDNEKQKLLDSFLWERFKGMSAPHVGNWQVCDSLEVAKKCAQSVSISTFSEVKPSFTKRGK